MAARSNNPLSRSVLDDDQVRALVELYENGMTLDEVAAEMFVAASTVRRYLVINGVPRRGHGPVVNARRHTPEEDGISLIKHLYWERGMSQRDIAERLGVCYHTIGGRMTRHGIPKRSRSEANRLSARDRRQHVPSEEERRRMSERMKRRWANGDFDGLHARRAEANALQEESERRAA